MVIPADGVGTGVRFVKCTFYEDGIHVMTFGHGNYIGLKYGGRRAIMRDVQLSIRKDGSTLGISP